MAVDLFSLRMNIETSGFGQAKAELQNLDAAGKQAALGATNFANAWEGAKMKFAGTAAEMATFKASFTSGFFNEKMVAGMSMAGQQAAIAGEGHRKMAAGIALASQQFKEAELAAQRNTLTYRAVDGVMNSSLARFFALTAVIGGVVGAYRSATSAVDAFRDSQIKLDGAARISGVSLAMLQGVSSQIQARFRLSADQANDLTAAAARMAQKTGDVNKTLPLLVSWLNVAAAQGMGAAQALQAMEITLRGQDEGLDRMFQKNPSVIWKEYAESIGKTVGQLTQEEKWLSIVTATMSAHEKVGEAYERRLDTTQGKSEQLDIKLKALAITAGKLIDPFRQLGIAIGGWITDSLIKLLSRWNMALQESLYYGQKLMSMVGLSSNPDAKTTSEREQGGFRGNIGNVSPLMAALGPIRAPATGQHGGSSRAAISLPAAPGMAGSLGEFAALAPGVFAPDTLAGGGIGPIALKSPLDTSGSLTPGVQNRPGVKLMSTLKQDLFDGLQQLQPFATGLQSFFATLFSSGKIGQSFKNFGKSILSGMGSIFSQMAMKAIAAAPLFQAIGAAMSNPFTAGAALLAFGIALKALGASMGGTAHGESGGGGTGGFGDRTTQITLSAAGAGGLTAPDRMPGNHYHVIGVESPQGTALLGQGVKAAQRRNLL